MDKTTEFKIFAHGKGTKTTYASLDEAQKIIVKNKLQPNIGEEFITVTETTTSYHKVCVDMETLSKENRDKLLLYIMNNIDKKEINCGLFFGNILYLAKHQNNGIFSKLMLDWFIDTFKISREIIDEKFSADDYYKTDWFKQFNNHPLYGSGYSVCLRTMLDMLDLDKYIFVYNTTNHKPCNNICLTIKDEYRKTAELRELQIRCNDFVIYYGSCYGRNVTLLNSKLVTDQNIDNFVKNLGLKL